MKEKTMAGDDFIRELAELYHLYISTSPREYYAAYAEKTFEECVEIGKTPEAKEGTFRYLDSNGNVLWPGLRLGLPIPKEWIDSSPVFKGVALTDSEKAQFHQFRTRITAMGSVGELFKQYLAETQYSPGVGAAVANAGSAAS